VAAWEKSGLSQAEFRRRRGIKAVTFGCGKRKLTGSRPPASPFPFSDAGIMRVQRFRNGAGRTLDEAEVTHTGAGDP